MSAQQWKLKHKVASPAAAFTSRNHAFDISALLGSFGAAGSPRAKATDKNRAPGSKGKSKVNQKGDATGQKRVKVLVALSVAVAGIIIML